MTVLITGAGIIGSHTAAMLAARGQSVLLLDRTPAHDAIRTIVDDPRVTVVAGDVTDVDALERLVGDHAVDAIVHTAALLSTAIRKDPLAGIHVNVMGTANVLEIARRRQLRRVVLASSATVGYQAFGDFDGTAFPEDFGMHYLRHRPASIYVGTKIAGEYLALLYRDLYRVDAVALRYAAVIGAWSGPGTSVPGKVLSSLLLPARRGETACIDDPFTVWNGGEEFIDARDCARANVAALDATAPTQGVYNIGLGTLASFDDFVAAVRLTHPDLQVRLDVRPAGGFAGFPHVRSAPSDISAATRELGWTPAHPLADAITHYAPLLA
ncbi:NAD(P)-dependent oxidoreductase [Comamonadaceae bacterium G21597-S1]|nr:NAD(P)-dependent oxidoreductase [Comamonadaceae bacterium G21597-S1]